MGRQFIYIINPISGTRNKQGLEKKITEGTKAANIPFTIFPSVASGDYSFLQPIIKEKKITDVIIVGGDGTISQVVGSLLGCNVNFGIIPSGSGNGLAYTAKIPPQPLKALSVILKGKPVATDGFMINGQFACMLCGLGLDAQVAFDFAQQSRRGLGTYVKQVVKNFFSAKTFPFEINAGGQSLVTDAFFISIANSNQFGNHFTIAPMASLSDGLLDIVIVTSQHKLSVVLKTVWQISGRNKLQTTNLIQKSKGVIYFQTDALSIRNQGGAPMHIDGDPAETPRSAGYFNP